jgi:hypothetical protein
MSHVYAMRNERTRSKRSAKVAKHGLQTINGPRLIWPS